MTVAELQRLLADCPPDAPVLVTSPGHEKGFLVDLQDVTLETLLVLESCHASRPHYAEGGIVITAHDVGQKVSSITAARLHTKKAAAN